MSETLQVVLTHLRYWLTEGEKNHPGSADMLRFLWIHSRVSNIARASLSIIAQNIFGAERKPNGRHVSLNALFPFYTRVISLSGVYWCYTISMCNVNLCQIRVGSWTHTVPHHLLRYTEVTIDSWRCHPLVCWCLQVKNQPPFPWLVPLWDSPKVVNTSAWWCKGKGPRMCSSLHSVANYWLTGSGLTWADCSFMRIWLV